MERCAISGIKQNLIYRDFCIVSENSSYCSCVQIFISSALLFSILPATLHGLAAKHTITVEHLAHSAWTKRWTGQTLKDKLERNGFRLKYIDEEENLINIQESYEVLYDLSELTEAEKNILEAFSVFPYIPLAAETCNEWLLEDAGASEDDDILMGLYQKGWLQFDIEREYASSFCSYSEQIRMSAGTDKP